MSYRITINGEPFCSSRAEHASLIDPKVKLEANKAGAFTFIMLPDHPYYDGIELRQSMFDIYLNDELIFEGIATGMTTDFFGRRTVECEGDLTFLNDSVQRQAVYQNQTTQTLLGAYLAVHNQQADTDKQFALGSVTVDGGSQIYRYTNFQNTMTEIGEDLIDNFGGYLRVRHENGTRYLDYISDSPRTSSQEIRIGKNLMDLSQNLSSLDICTVLIPLGAKLEGESEVEGLDKRLDIKSENSGRDYLVGTAAAYYGNIWGTQIWDDVTTASVLKSKGQDYLDEIQWSNLVIEASAIDLGLTSDDVEQFRVLDMIRVISEPHGLNRLFMLTKLDIDLDHPGNTQITLGQDQRLSLSARSARNTSQIRQAETDIIVNASENAKQILESSTDGNIYFKYGSNGKLYEIDIMDTDNPATARKIWRWNLGGWGYSDDGGQTYTVAATMDGAIVASLITTGILKSHDGTTFYLDLDNGVLRGNFSELKIAGAAGATQSYADGKASAAKAGAEATAANALSAFNTSLNQQEVFNRLTNNQANQGIYLENGQLYINASMIRAGMLISLAINNGNGTFAVDETGNVTATSGKIGNWSIGTNGLSNEFWNDDTIPYSGAAYYLQNLNQILLGTQFPSASEFFDYDANGDGKLNSTDLAIFTNMGQNSRNLNRYHDFTIELNSQTGRIALTEEYRARLGTTGTTFTGTRSTVIMPGAIQTGAYCGTDGYFSNQVSADKVIYSTLQQASDRSIKDKIRSIGKRFLNALKELNPVSFVYKHDKTQKERYGLIAQEVEKTDLSGLIGESGDMKSLNYMDLIAVLISGWQDHENRIKKLEERES